MSIKSKKVILSEQEIHFLRCSFYISAQYDYSFLENYFLNSKIPNFRKGDLVSGLRLQYPFLLHIIQTSYMYIEKVLKLIYFTLSENRNLTKEVSHSLHNYIGKIKSVKDRKDYFSFLSQGEMSTLNEIARLPFNPLRYLDEPIDTKDIEIYLLKQVLIKMHLKLKEETLDLDFEQSANIITLFNLEKVPKVLHFLDYKLIKESINITNLKKEYFFKFYELKNSSYCLKRVNQRQEAFLLKILNKTNIILSSQKFKIQVFGGKQ